MTNPIPTLKTLTGAVLLAVLVLGPAPVHAQDALSRLAASNAAANLLTNGGFEADAPSYWASSGAGATWSSDESRSPGLSLKLDGAGGDWVMDEGVRGWVGGFPAGGTPEIEIGGWVFTDGVNVGPTDDAGKFQLVFEFFDVPGGTNVLGGPVVLDLPQDAASTGGWVELSSLSLGAIAFPSEKAATSAKVTFRQGASTTGTAYLDDLFVRGLSDGWAGDWFNANVDVSDTWYYWLDTMAYNKDPWETSKPHFMYQTSAEAHSGNNSLRIEANPDYTGDERETVAVSDRVPVTAGEPVLISFWVKREGNLSPETITTGTNNLGLTVLWYENMTGGAAGYGEVGGVDVVMNDGNNEMLVPRLVQTADAGWAQYAYTVYPPSNAIATEIRLRYFHQFTGATYWDDVFIAPIADLTSDLAEMDLLTNGGFEADAPSYWASSGAGATWSGDQSRSPGLSLKLDGAGGDWVMDEGVRGWVGGFPAGGTPEIEIGGWVFTDGVNVGPTDDAGKFQLVFEFFDVPGGTNVLGGPVVLDLPQDAASTGGWVELSSLSLGAIAFPSEKAATSAKVTFRQGASTTGTAYLDDLFVRGLSDGWAGDWFNANVDVSDTWYYWLDTMAYNKDPWETSKPHFMYQTSAEAHSGNNSLRIEANPEYTGDERETVAVSDRVPVTPGEPVLMSFWVKREGNLSPETITTDTNNLGLTVLWYENMTGGAAGYGEVGGVDVVMNDGNNEMLVPRLVQTADAGWTQYAYTTYPPANAIATEIRLRYFHKFTGATYWDDVSIVPLGASALIATGTGIDDDAPEASELPMGFALLQNYPNPFNPSTSIQFELGFDAQVTLNVFNVLGQRVTSLLSGTRMQAGTHGVTFDASELNSGVYLYVLEVNGSAMARTMVLLK